MPSTRTFTLAAALFGAALLPAAGLALAAPSRPAPAPKPSAGVELFEKQVQPILAGQCFSCHAEKVQMAGLRLDSREAILKGGKSGPAFLAATPEKSPILNAIHYNGAVKMPPAGKLKPEEIAALEQWVKAGAPWSAQGGGGGLWSLQPIRNPAVPKPKNAAWAKNPIDAFLLAGLEKQGLKPSPYADRTTLIRRVSLDLIGLPPTPEEVDAFVRDTSPNAWEKVVDRLLASPHFGERMALHWLDLARYADSDGYHDDTDRYMWRYRDYVIHAFNTNKPFDQFTLEQLAGDLLPNATLEQKVASAFNRCGPTSSEGGAIPEEYMAKYAVDRVDTTGSVWLGLTIQCAECHNHKYDPLTTKDFYSLFSFFNQTPEDILYRGNDAPPTILIPTPEQQKQLDDMAGQIKALEAEQKAAGMDKAKVAEVEKRLAPIRAERAHIDQIARLRIMADVPQRRPTFVLVRGDYRNKGEEVHPAVPAAIGSLPEGKSDRIALAKWLTDLKNPLPARVTVNRFWQMLWGAGLVRSADDFGIRGEKPLYPELLDWLAHDFGHNGWDVKRTLKQLVMSAAYQQSSQVLPAMATRDPENRLLARGPRFRLQAELIRDNALAISGLLDRERTVGGASVKPYQPGDLWRELSSGDQQAKSYVQDHGPDLYRRGLYVWWKRSILYPAFSTYDAPKREVCHVKRPITNTPLQAFVTLNDTTYVEAARVFAQRILSRGGVNLQTRLTYAMRVALGRQPTGKERTVLSGIYQDALANYRADAEGAKKLISAGESPKAEGLDPAEHAAWTCVCNAILNLDETVTKE